MYTIDMFQLEGQAIALTQARQVLGDLVNIAVYEKEPVILMRNNRPVAALVSMEDLEHMERLEDRYWAELATEAKKEHATTGESYTAADDVWNELGL